MIVRILHERYAKMRRPESPQELQQLKEQMNSALISDIDISERIDYWPYILEYCTARMW